MKKAIILLAVLFSASILAHAATDEKSSPQAPVVQQPVIPEQVSPIKNDIEKVDNGSGDDIDTVDEGDPANDKDPEADDVSTAPGRS
jgi:hypothetical protein